MMAKSELNVNSLFFALCTQSFQSLRLVGTKVEIILMN